MPLPSGDLAVLWYSCGTIVLIITECAEVAHVEVRTDIFYNSESIILCCRAVCVPTVFSLRTRGAGIRAFKLMC